MSWDSITSKDFLSKPKNQNLSETYLLGSLDGSHHFPNKPNDSWLDDESISKVAGCGSNADNSSSLWTRKHFSRSHNSVLTCLFACQRSLKQYFAKKKIERGLRLYEQHNQNAAVRTWRSALNGTCSQEDYFQLLGYLYQAHMNWGKYREAIEFGHRQLGISEELDSPNMRAETYLNLSRAHERLGGLDRALSYARHSLYNECSSHCRTGGLVHLTVSRVYLEMGGFSRALEGLQGAYRIASAIGDPSLELQVYVALSELFGRLQDYDKSATYASKAYDLSRSLQLGDLNSSYHRAALLRMATSLRKQGEFGDANDYCMEATRLSLISEDQATYTRSIRVMGDIYRKKMDIERAFRHYEQAMGISAALGDRMAQMEAMDGAARCLEELRLQQKICNCRPLEFNTRLLEVASSIGAKLLVRKIRKRLASIYRALGDEDQCETQTRLANQTDSALGLNCGMCGETFGLEPNSLEALPCAHILHARCAYDLFRRREKGTNRVCPACNKLFSSRLHIYDSSNDKLEEETNQNEALPNNKDVLIDNGFNDMLIISTVLPQNEAKLSHNDNDDVNKTLLLSVPSSPQKLQYRSNLSLGSLSLRASNLTINSSKNATSSV